MRFFDYVGKLEIVVYNGNYYLSFGLLMVRVISSMNDQFICKSDVLESNKEICVILEKLQNGYMFKKYVLDVGWQQLSFKVGKFMNVKWFFERIILLLFFVIEILLDIGKFEFFFCLKVFCLSLFVWNQ